MTLSMLCNKPLLARYGRILLALAVVLVLALPAFAQTATPAPSLEIPVTTIFDEANSWIQVFAPILAIGIGISIALAILTFVGKQIISAFKG